MKRVLLTGASGLAGSHCLSFLLDNTDWEIVCPVSFKHRGVPERIMMCLAQEPQHQRDRVTVIYCDLAGPIVDTTKRLLGDVTHIINFASETSIAKSYADPVGFFKTNTDLMLNLLEYARALGDRLEAFVHLSTNEVYVPNDHALISEWDPIAPYAPYSASKAAQEALGIAYWRTYGVPLIIINSMNLFGETQDSNKYIPQLISRISKGEMVDVYTDGQGPLTQVFIHAREVASAILFLLRSKPPRMYAHGEYVVPDRWHVVGDNELDGIAMASMVADIMDKEFIPQFIAVDNRGRFALDGTKMSDAGWSQLRSLSGSLERMIEWTLANPLWLDREITNA